MAATALRRAARAGVAGHAQVHHARVPDPSHHARRREQRRAPGGSRRRRGGGRRRVVVAVPDAAFGFPPGRVDAYARAVALLCAALSPEELAAVVPELMAALAELARSAPLAVLDRRAGSAAESPSGPSGVPRARAPAELPRLASHAPLACAAALARIPAARRAWLARRGWGSAAEGLLTRRIPNADDLAVMLPARAACWPGAAAAEARFAPSGSSSYPGSPESESLCSSAGRALGEAMLRTQTLHAVLFRALVDPEPDAAFTPAEPGTTEDDAPTDFLVSALAEARRASAATAAATAASAAAGDPTAARRDQSFDADLDPDDEADFMASPAGSPAPRDSRRSRSEEEIADDGWPRERCRRSPLLVLLTWLASKNKNAGSNQMAQLTRNGRSARTGHSDPTVLASAYFATLSVLHPALEAPGGTPLAAPPTSLFHDSLAHQLDLPLFGGGAPTTSRRRTRPRSARARAGTGATTRGSCAWTPRTSAPRERRPRRRRSARRARAADASRGGGVLRLRPAPGGGARFRRLACDEALGHHAAPVPPGRRVPLQGGGVPAPDADPGRAAPRGREPEAGGCGALLARSRRVAKARGRSRGGRFRGERARRCLGGRTRRFHVSTTRSLGRVGIRPAGSRRRRATGRRAAGRRFAGEAPRRAALAARRGGGGGAAVLVAPRRAPPPGPAGGDVRGGGVRRRASPVRDGAPRRRAGIPRALARRQRQRHRRLGGRRGVHRGPNAPRRRRRGGARAFRWRRFRVARRRGVGRGDAFGGLAFGRLVGIRSREKPRRAVTARSRVPS